MNSDRELVMITRRLVFTVLSLAPVLVFGMLAAQADNSEPAASGLPDAKTLAEREAKRFPQPVRVGDLIGRQVLEPTEAQWVLGRVAGVARDKDGGLAFLISFGGVLGIGTHLISVPADAVALLGEYVSVLDFTPEQLGQFPAADEARVSTLGKDEIIRVGLTAPFH
jgi:hypothetical protein